jgi:hypothetical protein
VSDADGRVDTLIYQADYSIKQQQTSLHQAISIEIGVDQRTHVKPPKKQRGGDSEHTTWRAPLAGRYQFRLLKVRKDAATTSGVTLTRLG